jgi:hypothetical protein
VYVASTATLSGYTASTFGTAQAAAFKVAIASSLSVVASAVSITAVSDAPAVESGRHLLAAAVNIAFSVATTAAAAGTMSANLQSVTNNPAAALAAFQSAGLTACTALSVAAPAIGVTTPVDATATLPPTRTTSSGNQASAVARVGDRSAAAAAAALVIAHLAMLA